MTTGPRTVQRSSRLPGPICTGPSMRGLEQLAADVARDGAEHQAVGLEHVLEPAGVLPPAGDHVRLDAQAAVDHVLDGVGDLELAAGAGRDGLDAVEDGRREQVHAHQGEVAARLGRLLHEPRDAAGAVELGDAVALGSATFCRRMSASGSFCSNARTNGAMPSLSRLSPRYMTNGSSPRNASLMSTACASPSGASCGRYVTASPNRLPSPTAASISARVSPTTMPTSSIPAAFMASRP